MEAWLWKSATFRETSGLRETRRMRDNHVWAEGRMNWHGPIKASNYADGCGPVRSIALELNRATAYCTWSSRVSTSPSATPAHCCGAAWVGFARQPASRGFRVWTARSPSCACPVAVSLRQTVVAVGCDRLSHWAAVVADGLCGVRGGWCSVGLAPLVAATPQRFREGNRGCSSCESADRLPIGSAKRACARVARRPVDRLLGLAWGRAGVACTSFMAGRAFGGAEGRLEMVVGGRHTMLSSKRLVWFQGETRNETRRAENFLEKLRGPGGGREVTAQLPSGGTERTYISPEKNMRTVRMEMHNTRAT